MMLLIGVIRICSHSRYMSIILDTFVYVVIVYGTFPFCVKLACYVLCFFALSPYV
jgi:hypothetical protein